MSSKMHRIGRNSPCLCGSGKKFKNCCGQSSGGEGYVSDVLKHTQAPTHHFFVSNTDLSVIARNAEGKALVWTNRNKALAWGHAHPEQCFSPFAVVGMGDEKWAMFQEMEQAAGIEICE